MKTNLLKLVSLFTVMFFTLSCEDGDGVVTASDVTSDVVNESTLKRNQGLDDILDEVKELANAHDRVVLATVELIDGRYELTNVSVIEEKELSDFIIGTMQAETGTDASGTIKISCLIGDDIINHYCSSGPNQYVCVGRYVIACVNAGGCAETCPAELTVAPN